jgi:hypothetical protein
VVEAARATELARIHTPEESEKKPESPVGMRLEFENGGLPENDVEVGEVIGVSAGGGLCQEANGHGRWAVNGAEWGMADNGGRAVAAGLRDFVELGTDVEADVVLRGRAEQEESEDSESLPNSF